MIKMLKSTKVILLLLLFLNDSAEAKKTLFSGKVENPTGKELAIFFKTDAVTNHQEQLKATIDAKGYFKFVIEITRPQALYFRFGIEEAPSMTLFVEPGDSLFLMYDPHHLYTSARFSGKGAANNQLLNELILATNPKNDLMPRMYGQYYLLPPASFLRIIDSIYTIENRIVDKWRKKISANGLAYANSVVEFSSLLSRSIYPRQYAVNTRGKTVEPVPATYYSFLEKVRIPEKNIEAYVANGNFVHFFSEWLNYLCLQKDTSLTRNRDMLFVRKYQMAGNMLQGALSEYVKGYVINEAILGTKDYTVIAAMVNGFCSSSKLDKIILERIKTSFDIYSALSRGKPAPGFTLTSNDGATVSLSDFQGKVVYIDFWASWCVPCRKEMTFAPEIKEHFKGKDILYLYISIDESEEDWKKAIAKDKVSGVHVIAPGDFESALAKEYLLKMIPRYVIVGKKGEIRNGNAPRPSDPTLKSELEMALMF